jgi:hypothetical protein
MGLRELFARLTKSIRALLSGIRSEQDGGEADALGGVGQTDQPHLQFATDDTEGAHPSGEESGTYAV